MTLLGIRDKTDRQIQLDVLAEIARDVRFHPTEIGVEVDDGIVTLTGTVSSYVKLGQAADIAAGVYGVKDVANKLTVETSTIDDTKLAQAVRDALRWDAEVPEERIDSLVRDGVVTLKGTVDHGGQRAAARDAVAKIGGVRYVNDHLVVAPAPPRGDHQIFDDIKAALRRQLPVDDIDVAVDRGTVTLMGHAAWYGHRQRAEQAAWSTPGVRAVANKILVRV